MYCYVCRIQMYPPGNDHLLYVAGGQQAGFPLPTFKYNRWSNVSRETDWVMINHCIFDIKSYFNVRVCVQSNRCVVTRLRSLSAISWGRGHWVWPVCRRHAFYSLWLVSSGGYFCQCWSISELPVCQISHELIVNCWLQFTGIQHGGDTGYQWSADEQK